MSALLGAKSMDVASRDIVLATPLRHLDIIAQQIDVAGRCGDRSRSIGSPRRPNPPATSVTRQDGQGPRPDRPRCGSDRPRDRPRCRRRPRCQPPRSRASVTRGHAARSRSSVTMGHGTLTSVVVPGLTAALPLQVRPSCSMVKLQTPGSRPGTIDWSAPSGSRPPESCRRRRRPSLPPGHSRPAPVLDCS